VLPNIPGAEEDVEAVCDNQSPFYLDGG